MIQARGILRSSLLSLTFFLFACNGKNKVTVALAPPGSFTAQDSAAFADSLEKYGGPWHDAYCTGCQAPGVRIRAISKTRDINAKHGPDSPRVVAEIQNRSDVDVTHGPSQFVFKARRNYVMIVSRTGGAGSPAQWGLTHWGIGYDPKPVIGPLDACGDPVTNPKIDDANFYNCGDPHASSSAASFVKTAFGAEVTPNLLAVIPKRGWISCDPDCCTGAGTYSGPEL
jgi:hypothetical protein